MARVLSVPGGSEIRVALMRPDSAIDATSALRWSKPPS